MRAGRHRLDAGRHPQQLPHARGARRRRTRPGRSRRDPRRGQRPTRQVRPAPRPRSHERDRLHHRRDPRQQLQRHALGHRAEQLPHSRVDGLRAAERTDHRHRRPVGRHHAAPRRAGTLRRPAHAAQAAADQPRRHGRDPPPVLDQEHDGLRHQRPARLPPAGRHHLPPADRQRRDARFHLRGDLPHGPPRPAHGRGARHLPRPAVCREGRTRARRGRLRVGRTDGRGVPARRRAAADGARPATLPHPDHAGVAARRTPRHRRGHPAGEARRGRAEAGRARRDRPDRHDDRPRPAQLADRAAPGSLCAGRGCPRVGDHDAARGHLRPPRPVRRDVPGARRPVRQARLRRAERAAVRPRPRRQHPLPAQRALRRAGGPSAVPQVHPRPGASGAAPRRRAEGGARHRQGHGAVRPGPVRR